MPAMSTTARSIDGTAGFRHVGSASNGEIQSESDFELVGSRGRHLAARVLTRGRRLPAWPTGVTR